MGVTGQLGMIGDVMVEGSVFGMNISCIFVSKSRFCHDKIHSIHINYLIRDIRCKTSIQCPLKSCPVAVTG